MKLIKKQLLALPVTPLTKRPQRTKDSREYDYIYTAAAHENILAIELFPWDASPSKEGPPPQYRVFCTENRWINYDVAQGKWGTATLEHIGQSQAEYWRGNQLLPADTSSADAGQQVLGAYMKAGWRENTAELVREMQFRVQREQDRAKLQKAREETEEIFSDWPDLPQGWEKRLKDGPWAHSKYCFYQKTPKDSLSLAQKLIEKELPGTNQPYIGQCTACGKSFGLPGPLDHTSGKPIAQGTYQCPCCGAWLHPKKAGLGRGNLWESKYLLLATAREGRVYLDLIYASREYRQPPFHTRFWHEYRWLLDTKNNTATMWRYEGSQWRKMEQANEPPNIAYIVDSSVEEAINATRLRYAKGLIDKNGLIRTAAALTRYPALELVDKVGHPSWATGVIWRHSFAKQAINLKGKTMKEALGLDKGELARAKTQCETCFELFVFQALRREGKWYTEAQKETVKDILEKKKFVKIAELTGMAKALNYVEKQRDSASVTRRSVADMIALWADYLEECRILQYDLADPYNQMPPDLMTAHGRTMQLVSDMQNEELNGQIKKRLAHLEKYNYAADGLLIRPAKSVGELKAEGAVLHHCVATYAEKYASGKTIILIVRSQEEPEVPFVTVEYRNNRIIQARADHNGAPPKEVTEFLEQWEKQLKREKRTKLAIAC